MTLPNTLTLMKNSRKRATLLTSLLISAAIVVTGCGSTNETSNSAANSNTLTTNTAANSMSNLGTNSTSNAASNSIAKTGNVHLPDSAISAETLIGALKTRLSHDNPTAMPQADDRSDLWLDSSVGSFYKNDDEITKLMVCDITEKTLGEFNKKLKPFAKQKLHDAVSAHTSCREAVNLMFKATLNSTPINPVP